MTFKIQRFPRGLNSLLSIFGGQAPIELEDKVRAVVDATEMYGTSLQVIQVDTLAAGAINRTAAGTMTVPGRLLHMSGSVIMGAAAGTFVKMALLYSPAGAATLNLVCVGQVQYFAPSLIAAATLRVSAVFSKPIVFSPGARFQIEVSGDAGGADHVQSVQSLFESYPL